MSNKRLTLRVVSHPNHLAGTRYRPTLDWLVTAIDTAAAVHGYDPADALNTGSISLCLPEDVYNHCDAVGVFVLVGAEKYFAYPARIPKLVPVLKAPPGRIDGEVCIILLTQRTTHGHASTTDADPNAV